ncbi:MAG: hypothetical protein HY812_05540 [Planctomycetes bacterium]|nr:hypothetical protein [Planctomycetota bacterium]
MRHLTTCLLLAGALAAGGRAALQESGEDLCGDCHSTGKVPHAHDSALLELEKDAIFCSCFMDQDPEALGMDWIVCPDCRTPSAQARARSEFEMEYGRRKSWLEERRAKVDKHAGEEVLHIKTRHFVIAWDIPKVKVDHQVLKAHEAMHLYARRMEDLYRVIQEVHGIGETAMHTGVYHLYLFESQKVAERVGGYVLDGIGGGGAKSLIGPNSAHLRWWRKEDLPDDERFHQALAHSVSHLIHNDIDQFNEWLAVRYGWAYEGLAHFIEIRLFGPPITWCHQETGGFEHWKGKDWEANVKKAVLAGTQPAFQEIITKASDVLTPMEHQFSWSYIDYLMWLDPKKMPRLLGLMKGPQLPVRDALQQAYGLTVGQFVDGWEEFVRTEYSIKPVKGPRPRAPRAGG